MKHYVIIPLLLLSTAVLYCQEINLTIAPTLNFAPRYQMVTGSAGQKFKPGFSSSINYYFNSEKKINLGLGLNYQYGQVEFTPNMNTGDFTGQIDKINIISIKLLTRLDLNHDLFINLNPLLDFQIDYNDDLILDNQSGLGIAFSIGKYFRLSDKVYVIVEPKTWIHNIVPFKNSDLPYRMTVFGLNAGVRFNLNN